MLLFVACWQARGIVQRSFTLLVMSGTFLLLLFCFCICFCLSFHLCYLLFVGRRATSFNVVVHCLSWVICFNYYYFAFVFAFVLLLIFVVCCLLAGARHCSTPLHITCHAWYVYVIIILLLYLLLFIFNFCCLLFVGRRAASFNVVTHCLPWVVCFSYYCFAFVFVFVLFLIFVVCCLLTGARHCSTSLHITCHECVRSACSLGRLSLTCQASPIWLASNLPYKGIG